MVGALIGALISKPISNSLLSSENKSSMNSSEKIKGNFGRPRGFDFGVITYLKQ